MRRRITRVLTSAQTWLAVRVFIARSVLATLVGLAVWSIIPLALGWNASSIMSGSMMPAIRPGQVVAASPVEHADIGPGQIITFVDPDSDSDRLVTHRVVRIDEQGRLITRGDANEVDDATPLAAGDTWLGRLSIPLVGMPRLWLAEGDVASLVLSWLGLTALSIAAIDRPLCRRVKVAGGGRAGIRRTTTEGVAAALVLAIAIVPIGASAAAFTAMSAGGFHRWTAAPAQLPDFGDFGDAVMASSPFAFYRLEESGGTTVIDSSGGGHHGFWVGAPDVTVAGGLPGQMSPNLGAAFNGASAIASDSRFPDAGSFTLTALLQTRGWPWSDNAETRTIFEFRTPDGFSDRVFTMWGSLFYQADQESAPIALQRHLQEEHWHHFTLTVDGGSIRMKLNGSEAWTSSTTRATDQGALRFVIGTHLQPYHDTHALGIQGFHGVMDDIALFPRALSPAELEAHWQASGLPG